MRVNCREQIANPAEPVNGQDERRKCAAVDSPARLCCSVIITTSKLVVMIWRRKNTNYCAKNPDAVHNRIGIKHVRISI